MVQPVQNLRKRLQVGLICVRYGRREVIHHDRLAESIDLVIVVHVPARVDPRLEGL